MTDPDPSAHPPTVTPGDDKDKDHARSDQPQQGISGPDQRGDDRDGLIRADLVSEGASLECPCCGCEGAVPDGEGLFSDGQKLICGCPGWVSVDEDDAWINNGDLPCAQCEAGGRRVGQITGAKLMLAGARERN